MPGAMAISDALGSRRTVEVPAGTLEYRERGSGPTVVFAHGAAVNGDLWRRVAPELASGHRTIVPDLPLGGHSIPLRPGADLSLFGAADVLGSFIDELGLEDVTLVANDTGGALSQALVSRRPERVSGLVLTSCDAFENYPPTAVAYLKHVSRVAPALWLLTQAMRLRTAQRLPIAYGWATHRPIEPAIMESYLTGLRTNAGVRRDFASLLTRADRRDMVAASEAVGAFSGPALVVWGADDRFFPREHGRRLAGLMPQARFELVAGSRTFIPEDRPEPLVALLSEFLGESGTETTLRSGDRVLVRPIRPGDKDGLRDVLHRLSPESRYRRFFSPVKELGVAQLHYLTEVDHHTHEALVAIDPETGHPIAVARFIRARPEAPAAEVAVAVIDDWQGRGLGSELLHRLAARAREEGVGRFSAYVLEGNRSMLELLDGLGDHHVVSHDGGVMEIVTELPEEGSPAAMRAAVRAAARGDLAVEGRHPVGPDQRA
jgi:pimeloyl-ACP methyl ester carboxylesterase/GNAT superfamily N-acetyltransferase